MSGCIATTHSLGVHITPSLPKLNSKPDEDFISETVPVVCSDGSDVKWCVFQQWVFCGFILLTVPNRLDLCTSRLMASDLQSTPCQACLAISVDSKSICITPEFKISSVLSCAWSLGSLERESFGKID